MTKEKFMYKLVDQYIYPACLGQIAVENFWLSDGSDYYMNLMECFGNSIEWYDNLRVNIQGKQFTEEEVDVLLNESINELHQKTIATIVDVFKLIAEKYLPDEKEGWIEEELLGRDKQYKEPNEETLLSLMNKIRTKEAKKAEKGKYCGKPKFDQES